ncbi:TPA: hypothetical protein ACYEK4_005340 [Klebsiella pneumoniae]
MDIEKLRSYIIKNSVIFEQIYHPDPYSELDLNAKLTKLDNAKIYDVYDLVDEDKNESLNTQFNKNIDIENLRFIFTYGDFSFQKFESFTRRKTRFPMIPVKNVFNEKIDMNNILNIDLIEAFAILNQEKYHDNETYKYIKLEEAFKKFTKYRYFKKNDNQRIRMITELAKVFLHSEHFFQFVFKDYSVIRTAHSGCISTAERILIENQLEENKNHQITQRKKRL